MTLDVNNGLITRHSLYELVQYNGVGYRSNILGTFESRDEAKRRKRWLEGQKAMTNLYIVHHNVFPLQDRSEADPKEDEQ